jgi:hypothetical protein
MVGISVLCSHSATLIVPVNPGLVPRYKIFLSFPGEPLHHIEPMLRKVDPIGLLCIGQAMGYPPRGEETKLGVVQNSENCRPWREEGLTDLAAERMRLPLKKSENCITKIVLRGPFWPLVILDSLPACLKSRYLLLDNPKAQCILVITLFKFGDDLCVPFPAKTIVSDEGSLLKQEGHS